MATFDKLAAEQRAIIELVLQRGQTYDDLSGMLGMPATRVRDLAREALGELAPTTAERVDSEWRGQVADYVLGQQSGPQSTATRGHLKRSEPARSWAMSLLDSLDHLYENGSKPVIPEGEPDAAPHAAAVPRRKRRDREKSSGRAGRERKSGGPLSSGARTVVMRRRILGGAIALIAIAVGAFLIFGGDGDGDGKASSNQEAGRQEAQLLAQGVLRPTRGEEGAGIAAVFQRGEDRQLVVQASGLKRSGQEQAYEVWLYNSKDDAKSMGAQVTDQQGNYQGAGPLPDDYERYRFIDLSREPLDGDTKHSGESVLRGRLEAPAQNGQGQGATPTTPEAP